MNEEEAMVRHKTMVAALLIPAVLLIGGAALASPAGLQLAAKKVLLIGKCPYNLDKECTRLRNGKLVNCRCVS